MDHKWTVGRCLLYISSCIPTWTSVWTVSEKPSVSIWVSLKSYFRKLTSARQQIFMTLFSIWLKSLISISLLCKVLVNSTQMEQLDPNPSLLTLNHVTPTRWLCIKFHENQESEQQRVCPYPLHNYPRPNLEELGSCIFTRASDSHYQANSFKWNKFLGPILVT